MSTFGRAYRVTTYGESHCASVGAIIDGIPPGLALSPADIQIQLTRRRPGQSSLTTPRNEKDAVHIQSGVEHGITLGTPIAILVKNEDQRPKDYSETDLYPRPSHADYTYLEKYGVKASSGGGRSSARETIGRVAAGAIAEKYLKEAWGIEIVAFVSSVGKIHLDTSDNTVQVDGDSDDTLPPISEEYAALLKNITRDEVDKYLTRCPNEEVSQRMIARIERSIAAKDSIGGTVTCVIRGLPSGLGEPVFDKFEALLAHAMLSIPATKAFEIGSGFKGCEVKGSQHNDLFIPTSSTPSESRQALITETNNSGGVQGGITNAAPVFFRVGFKPPATISLPQATATYAGVSGELAARGRHDPCVVPRAVPIVEGMAACVVLDALLLQEGRKALASRIKPSLSIPPSMSGVYGQSTPKDIGEQAPKVGDE